MALTTTASPSHQDLEAAAPEDANITKTTSSGDDEEERYDLPQSYSGLDELEDPAPVQNPEESQLYRRTTLEDLRQEEEDEATARERTSGEKSELPREDLSDKSHHISKWATQIYTVSYLVFFAILGTLARLGLQGLTFYPGAPVEFSVLWANFGGSLFMGFLSEDRMLFREEWGTATYHQQLQSAKKQKIDEERGIEQSNGTIDLAAAKKAHNTTKKTIPLYIGLATGFCGSFTSFSSFIRDVFLALSNELATPLNHPSDYSTTSTTSSTVPRNGGYSFMALVAVIIVTISVSLSALHIGAHLAIASEPFTPSLPFRFTRKFIDRTVVVLGLGCWIGAIILAAVPPDRNSATEIWRGRAVFAIVFAPVGCLCRFYASMYLNPKIASFPLGTFAVNIFGTAILGMSWALQHAPVGGVIGCQVLQGVEDGFCGCLTTVSTWVSELSSLRRFHAYRYGGLSVIVALCFLIVIMGSLQWTQGLSPLQCVTG